MPKKKSSALKVRRAVFKRYQELIRKAARQLLAEKERQGLTYRELSRRLRLHSISPGFQPLRKDRFVPTLRNIVRIADAMGLTVTLNLRRKGRRR